VEEYRKEDRVRSDRGIRFSSRFVLACSLVLDTRLNEREIGMRC
jgi:hypothetical protein